MVMLAVSCSSDDGDIRGDANTEPKINNLNQTVSVAENIGDTETIFTVDAFDPDTDDTITYEIIQNSGNLFEVDGNGIVTLAAGASLDFETSTAHTLGISVTDGKQGSSAEITITIAVLNLIENLFQDPESFIFKIQTSQSNEQFVLSTFETITDIEVDWGDNTEVSEFVAPLQSEASHIYVEEGTYTVAIKGDVGRMSFSNSAKQFLTVEQWGAIAWKSTEMMFSNTNVKINATDKPNLTSCTSMKGMFSDCIEFNNDISGWDVSFVQDFSYMFSGAEKFNQDISVWKIDSAVDMVHMFAGALLFNQDISIWVMSEVESVDFMFNNAQSFNQNLGNWDIGGLVVDKNMGLFDANMRGLIIGSGMTPAKFSATLIGWANDNEGEQMIPQGISLGASGLALCNDEEETGVALFNLDNNGWEFFGDEPFFVNCD